MTEEDLFDGPAVQTAERLLDVESLRVATFKIRRGKRHLMCGRQDHMRPLCRTRLAPVILPACKLLHPSQITCRRCRVLAKVLATAAANDEQIDLRDEGAFQIFSDMLLERATPKSLFIRRLVLVFECLNHELLSSVEMYQNARSLKTSRRIEF